MLSWQSLQRTPAFYSWAGYSFELLSLLHVEQIKRRLGISGVLTHAYSWRSAKAQIDLVIDRNDNTVNLCEMTFCEDIFEIDSRYEAVRSNTHSGMIQNGVILDDLFA